MTPSGKTLNRNLTFSPRREEHIAQICGLLSINRYTMSVDNHFKSTCTTRKDDKDSSETDVIDASYDLLGFNENVAVIKHKADVTEEVKQSAKISVNSDANRPSIRSNSICGKQVILKTNLSGQVVVINKNVEFPLKCQSFVESIDSFGGDSISEMIFSKFNGLDSCANNLSCVNLQSHQGKASNRCANADNDDDLLSVALDGDKIKTSDQHRTTDKTELEVLICKKPLRTYKGKRIFAASASRFDKNAAASFKWVKKVEWDGEINDADVANQMKMSGDAKPGEQVSKKFPIAKLRQIAPKVVVEAQGEDAKPMLCFPHGGFLKLKQLKNLTDGSHETTKQTNNQVNETRGCLNSQSPLHSVLILKQETKDCGDDPVENVDELQETAHVENPSAVRVRRKRKAKRRSMMIMREFEKFMRLKGRTKRNKRTRRSRQRDVSCQVHSETSNGSTQTELTGDGKDGGDKVFLEEKTIIGSDVLMGCGPRMSPYQGDSRFMEGKILCFDSAVQGIPSQDLQMYDGTYSIMDDTMGKKMFHEYLMNCIQVDSMGNLQIHLEAMNNNSSEARRQCIALKLRQVSIDTINNSELTPLHLAITYGCNQVVDVLLKYGADIGSIDSVGNNGIHLAVLHNEGLILQKLLFEAQRRLMNVDSYNYEGFTPLMLCALEKKSALAGWLLNSGADPNLKDQKSGRTPLFHAVENNDIEMAKLLLLSNADTKIRNFFGTSTHEAMFELENVAIELKTMIIGKDVFQNKKKITERKKRSPRPPEKPEPSKRPKLKTTQTFRKIKHN